MLVTCTSDYSSLIATITKFTILATECTIINRFVSSRNNRNGRLWSNACAWLFVLGWAAKNKIYFQVYTLYVCSNALTQIHACFELTGVQILKLPEWGADGAIMQHRRVFSNVYVHCTVNTHVVQLWGSETSNVLEKLSRVIGRASLRPNWWHPRWRFSVFLHLCGRGTGKLRKWQSKISKNWNFLKLKVL